MKIIFKNNIKTLAACIVLLMLLIYTPSILAQPCGPGVGTVLFNEDFEGEADGATSGTDAGGVAWTATCPGCAASDFFEVDNNSGNAMGCNGTNGLRGNDTNGPGTFTATVDLTGCEVVYFGFDYCATGYTNTGNLECVTECSGCSGVPSEGVSNGGCNNCWDFLYGELDWGTGNSQQILLGDDCDAPPNGTTGNAICGSTDADGNPIDPADLTSVDINIVMAMWAGTENMVIDNIMVICYTAAEVAACADATVADACPIVCPDLTTIAAGDLDVNVTESTCPSGQMTPSGGSIAAPAMMCPMGSTLEYSLDNFATAGTTTPPMYDQSNAIMVSTRCVCDDDPADVSTTSTVTTVPGMCAMCPDLMAPGNEAPAVTIDSEAGCDTATFTTTTGATSAPTATCPMGSSIEYSVDMGATWATSYTDAYDQTMPVEIRTRCVCDSDATVIGPETTVTTNPQPACPAEVCPACDCNAAPDSYTINTVATGQTGYTTVYVLVDNDNGNTVLQNNQTGMFTPVPDNTNYTVYAYNVLDAEVGAFTGALPGTIAAVGDAIGAFCAAGIAEPFFQDCDCGVPSVAIDKDDADNTDDTQTVISGGDATFTITVTNNGTEDLCNVTVTDPNSATCEMTYTANGGTLAVGDSWTYTCTLTGVTADLINTATVNAEGCGSGDPVDDTDDTEVLVTEEVCPSCNCTAASGDYYTINTTAIGQSGYTTVYILVDNDNGNIVLQNNQTGMFTPVPDNVNYTVYAYNVLNSEVTAFEAAIPANISAVGDAIGTFCAAGAFEPFFQDCDCCPDDITATISGGGRSCNGDTVDLIVTISGGGVGPYDIQLSDGTVITGYNSGDAISVAPTTNTTYGVATIVDTNGCPGMVSGSAEVMVIISCANAGSLNGSGN